MTHTITLKILWLSSFLLSIDYCTGQSHYYNIAQALGIVHSYVVGPIGGGVSFSDFNQDGWDDLTFATSSDEKIQFYINDHGEFEPISLSINHTGEARQVLWVDFDNDGDKDFYVASGKGVNRLYKNLGGLQMIDFTEQAGLALNVGRSYGACWGDYNRDGWLDLYYTDLEVPFNQEMNECRMFLSNGDGTFIETTYYAGVADQGKKPFCSAFLDYNNDGWPDIYTAHDKLTINSLFENDKNGTFSNVGTESNSDLAMFAMCVTVGDYDNDGWQDIYVTNTVGNALLHNKSNLGQTQIIFEEIAVDLGVDFNGIGWGSSFLDADNDGDLDLYVSGSLIGFNNISSRFYENTGDGHFIIPENGFLGDTLLSFSNAIGDFDNDGYPDIAVNNVSPFISNIWTSEPGVNNWLKIHLNGVISNRDAIGTSLELFIDGIKQSRYTHCGTGFLGQNSSCEIFGLAHHLCVDSLYIRWPTGHVDKMYNLVANSKLDIQEGSTSNGNIFIDSTINTVITSSKDVNKSYNFYRLFPNPAYDKLTIEIDAASIINIEMYDINGRRLWQKIPLNNQWDVDISEYITGIYFIRFIDKNDNHHLKKWIKI